MSRQRDHLYEQPGGDDGSLDLRLDLDAIPTIPVDEPHDALGLASTFPRSGWVVIDAIRERSFTGEVACRTTPPVTVWADRGRVYCAEREGDGPLGVRLVASGALTAAQLAEGAVVIAGSEHLGKLFDRVPTIDRDAVLVAADLLNEECIGWLAGQRVYGAAVTPYRHHPAGINRWQDAPAAAFPPPASPLPSPSPLPSQPPPPSPPPAPAPVPAAPFAPPAVTPAPLPPPAPATPAIAPPATPAAPVAPPFAPPAGGGLLPPATMAPVAPPVPAVDIEPVETIETVETVETVEWIEPLAAPAPADPVPAAARITEPAVDSDGDELIRWGVPGFLDRPLAGDLPAGLITPLPVPGQGRRRTDRVDATSGIAAPAAGATASSASALAVSPDWIDRLGSVGLPRRNDDPLVQPVKLPPVHTDAQLDRFEVIWPSGEVDEQFGGQPVEPFPDPDIDRAGPTARLVRDGAAKGAAVVDDDLDAAVAGGVADIEQFLAGEARRSGPAGGDVTGDVTGDDVLEAVRNAVAGIELGAMVRGERRIGPRSGAVITTGLDGATSMVRPNRSGREVTGEIPVTSTGRMTHPHPSTGSVFDGVPMPSVIIEATEFPVAVEEPEAERATALRRLIGSLRKR